VIPREACLLLNQFVREAQTAMASGKRQVTTAEVLDEILRDSDSDISDISDVDSGDTGTQSESESDSNNHRRNVQPPKKHFAAPDQVSE